MDRLRQDLAFALRLLRKDRAFAATTILTLAVCLGANAAIFTVVRSVLLRPLPYPEADRLVVRVRRVPRRRRRAGRHLRPELLRPPRVHRRRSSRRRSTASTGCASAPGPSAEGVASMDVTPSFFRVLRTRAVRGRLFTEDDGQAGRNQVVRARRRTSPRGSRAASTASSAGSSA